MQSISRLSLLSVLLIWTLVVNAAHAQDLRENAFFKALEGTWAGEGTVTNQNEEVTPVKNKVVASFSEDGRMFTIKGKLQVNDEEMEYRWEYTVHSIEGLYAGKFFDAQGKETLFDASVDESNLTARVVQTSGVSGDPRIELEKKIVDGKYQAKFSIINSSGTATLTGKLGFQKE